MYVHEGNAYKYVYIILLQHQIISQTELRVQHKINTHFFFFAPIWSNLHTVLNHLKTNDQSLVLEKITNFFLFFEAPPTLESAGLVT